MIYEYYPHGVCARLITLDIAEDETINRIHFLGGCAGNAQGIAALAQGRKAQEVIPLLGGIVCDHKSTSCPNELTRALQDALNAQKQSKH